MTTAVSQKIALDALPLRQQAGSLQGRTVTTHATEKSQLSVWNQICRWMREFACWIKGIFTAAPLKKKEKLETEIPLPSTAVDTSFLRPNDSAYNLQRLGSMTAANAIQSISTEEAFKSLPRKNAIRLGYEDPVRYQTVLGDQAIAAQTALTGLGIFALSRWLRTSCMVGKSAADMRRVYHICSKEAADFWQNTPGRTMLAVCAALLFVSIRAHSSGRLGELLHDRLSSWRQSRIETLFQGAAKELKRQAKTNLAAAKDLSRKILKNSELIEISLHVELQLPKEKAARSANLLKSACQDILDPNPMFERTP